MTSQPTPAQIQPQTLPQRQAPRQTPTQPPTPTLAAPPTRHLVIPGAGLPADAQGDAMTARSRHAQQRSALPNLRALMPYLQWVGTVTCDDDQPAMPHEIVLARLLGLTDEPGYTPWAAFDTGTVGTPCAWITPCHWVLGTNEVSVADPQHLALNEGDSKALMAAAAPYFLEDGITLVYHRADAWLAVGEPLRRLRCFSLPRVMGSTIRGALFGAGEQGTQAATTLRRLQNEMQMLFYTHPIHDTRLARGQLPINSFWISGAGVLDRTVATPGGVQLEPRLCTTQAQQDPSTNAQLWADLDATVIADVLASARLGMPVQLTFSGHHQAHTYGGSAPSFLNQFKRAIGLQRTWIMREVL